MHFKTEKTRAICEYDVLLRDTHKNKSIFYNVQFKIITVCKDCI